MKLQLPKLQNNNNEIKTFKSTARFSEDYENDEGVL